MELTIKINIDKDSAGNINIHDIEINIDKDSAGNIIIRDIVPTISVPTADIAIANKENAIPATDMAIINKEDTISEIDTATISEGDFFLSESHKKYNYVTFGKTSDLRLPKNVYITAVYGSINLHPHTHKTQLNRIDGLKQILDNFDVGEHIFVFWDAMSKTLTFEKSKSEE